MTLSTTATKVTYQGNGAATEFDFNFIIPSQVYLQVIIVDEDGDSTELLTSQYSVTGINNPNGGTVTYPLSGSPLATGSYISIIRNLPLKQLIAIANQGNFYPATVESALDYLMMVAQQVAGTFGRAIVAPVTDPDILLPLPPFNQRANQLLGFDADGNPIAAEPSSALVSAAMQPVVASATLAAARTAFGLAALAELGQGRGLSDQGGNATVTFNFESIGINESPVAADHLKRYKATAALTFTLAKADTYWNGYGIWIDSGNDEQTVAINAADNFDGNASGVSLTIPPRTVAYISTDGAAVWYVSYTPAFTPMPAPFIGVVTPGGRLTLTTGVPVLSSNVTGASTIYYTPYLHNIVSLYDGVSWIPKIFTQLSQALNDGTKSPSAASADSVYDMFVWYDNGTMRCTRGPAWISATARGTGAGTTELELFQGRYVNANAITNGPGARRGLYVGTIATNASTQCAMNFNPAAAAGGTGNRLDVWNMYNRVNVAAVSRDSTNSWNYTTATLRAANAAVASGLNNSISLVVGLQEDVVAATYQVPFSNTNAAVGAINGIGLDSTSAIAAGSLPGAALSAATSGAISSVIASFSGLVGIGLHRLQALEYSAVVGTTTWYGDNGAATLYQMGLTANVRM